MRRKGGTRNNSGIRKSELRKKKKIELFFVKIQNNQPKSKKEIFIFTLNISTSTYSTIIGSSSPKIYVFYSCI